jgi:hypothetical protein
MAAFIQKTAAMGNSIKGTVSKNGYYYSLEKGMGSKRKFIC